MVETVYVLGYSGSGKTTAARCLEMLIRDTDKTWTASRFNDYYIMYDWFLNDFEQHWFRPTECKGFDILVPEIYDEAMKELVRKIHAYVASERELMIIDFARCDYSSSFALLGKELLQHAYFLFLDADLETCMQRIERRVLSPQSIDDHFVPQSVMECFDQHGKHYIRSTISELINNYGVSENKVIIIDNGPAKSLENLYKRLSDFVDSLMLIITEVTS